MPDFNPAPKSTPKPKRQPTPLKRTPLKPKAYTFKKPKPIAKVSAKQSANLKKYEAGKREKYGDTPDVCTGSGRVGQISCSHLVARSHSFELVAEKTNHERQCFACADLTERGQYFQLQNGLALLERLWCGLGEHGRARFWKIWGQWSQNQDLWQMSSFYDREIHS